MRRLLVAGLVGLALTWLAVAPARAESGVTEVCRFSDQRLVEISGLAWSPTHPGVIWTHNDSGGGPYIYAIDARTCRTLARVRISGVPARDIEAIAPGRDAKGRPVLWVADIGDNNDSWPYVMIYRIREPSTIASVTVPARTYRVRYADRPHNAETLLASPSSPQLWIVTKQLAHGSLYILPAELSTSKVNVARPIHVEGGLVTDGAISPDGTRYVLRDYVNGTMFAGMPLGRNLGEFPLPLQVQGEAITWTRDGTALLVASERDDRLLRVELPASVRLDLAGTGRARVSG
jgi:hypothetical protein